MRPSLSTSTRTRTRTSLRTRTRAATLLVAAVLPLVTACVNADEKARRDEEAMVALAREEMEAESLFVHDSVAIAASITLDTIDVLERTLPMLNWERDTVAEAQFVARTRAGASCLLDSAHFARVAKGDTLRCQWDTTGVRPAAPGSTTK